MEKENRSLLLNAMSIWGIVLEWFTGLSWSDFSLRNQYKKKQNLKKATKVGDSDTKVDITITVVDLDEINAVDGDFRVKFKVHAIYKFDSRQKKESVSL